MIRFSKNIEEAVRKKRNKLRNSFYLANNSILNLVKDYSILYKVFMIIEYLQLTFFIIDTRIYRMWTLSFLEYLRTICKYFQFKSNLMSFDGNTWLYITMGILLFLVIVILGYFYVVSHKIRDRNNHQSNLYSVALFAIAFILMLYNTIMTIPISQFIFNGFFCQNSTTAEYKCSTSLFLRLTVSCFGLTLHMIIVTFLGFFMINLDPFSFSPLSGKLSIHQLLNNYKKVFMSLTIFLPLSFKALTPCFIFLLNFVHLFVLLSQPSSIDQSLNFLRVGSAGIFMTISGSVFLQSALDTTGSIDNLGFLYCFVASLLVSGLIYSYEQSKMQSWVRNFSRIGKLGLVVRGSKALPTNLGFGESDVVRFAYSMIVMAENTDEKVQRAIVHSLIKDIYSGLGSKDPIIFKLSKKILLMKDEKSEEYKREIYKLVMEILYFMHEVFPHSTYIDLLISYIAHNKLNLIWVSLYKLQTLERVKGNIRIVFSGVRFMTQIESEIKEKEIRKMETTGLNVSYVLKFQTTYFNLCKSVSEAVEHHYNFWEELSQSRPVIKKIQNIGSKITTNLDDCRKLYKKISDMNPNHFKTLSLFGNFIEFILNDEEESRKLLSKADYINKSSDLNKGMAKDTRVKYSENADFCIVVTSGNDKDIGCIKGFNSELLRRFGYAFDEIKGMNVDLLMPQIIKEHHNKFMKNYFESNKASVMGVERPVFPMDKNGFILPQNLLIKVIPNLERGLEVIGLLSNIAVPYDRYSDKNHDKDHYILFDQKTGIVLGVSAGCYYEFGIRPDIVDGNTRSSNILNMVNIFPDEKFDGKKISASRKKKLPVLDTSKIPMNFYIDKSDFLRIGLPKMGKETFRRYPVKYELTDPESFGLDANLVLMTFRLADGKQIRKINSMVRDFADDKADKMKNFIGQFNENDEEMQALIDQQKKKKRMDKYKDDGNMMNRWKRQQETNTADRERKIRERKIELGQKKVPKTIGILKCSLIFVFLATSLMNGLEKILKFTLSKNIQSGQKSIKFLGEKEALVPNIYYRVRVLDMIANFYDGVITEAGENGANFQNEKDYLSMLLGDINTSQTEFEKNYLHYLENEMVNKDPINEYGILTPKGEVNNIPLKFIFGIFQYISSAETINISTQEELTNRDQDSQEENYSKADIAKYFIFNNFANNLLTVHEEIRNRAFNALGDSINRSISQFFILLIVQLLVVIVSILALLPLIFKVHRGMTQVMSLFAYVSKDEITNLAARCELFRENYLKQIDYMREGTVGFKHDEADSREASMMDFMSQGSKVDDLFNLEKRDNKMESDLSHNYEGDESLERSYKKEEIDMQLEELKRESGSMDSEEMLEDQDISDINFDSPNKVLNTEDKLLKSDNKGEKKGKGVVKKKRRKNKKNLMSELEANIKKAEDDASVNDSEKFEILHNFKENFTQFYLLKAGITALILFVILILNYFWTQDLGDSMIKATAHLNTLSKLNTRLNYLNSFTLETVNNGKLFKIEGENMIEIYDEMIYSLLNDLNTNIKNTFHFTLSDYQSLYSRISNDDVCSNFFSKEPSYNFTDCATDEFFTKGLQTLIIKVNEDTRSISQSYSDEKKTQAPSQSTLNRLSVIDLFTRRISFTIQWLVSTLSNDLDKTLNIFDLGDYVSYAALNFFLAFIYCFLWVPYIFDLKNRIWRAQGMVNMIPFRVINENRELMKSMEKAHFL